MEPEGGIGCRQILTIHGKGRIGQLVAIRIVEGIARYLFGKERPHLQWVDQGIVAICRLKIALQGGADGRGIVGRQNVQGNHFRNRSPGLIGARQTNTDIASNRRTAGAVETIGRRIKVQPLGIAGGNRTATAEKSAHIDPITKLAVAVGKTPLGQNILKGAALRQIRHTQGNSGVDGRRIVAVVHQQIKIVGRTHPGFVGGCHLQTQLAHLLASGESQKRQRGQICRARFAIEGVGICIKLQPTGQAAAISQLGGELQRIFAQGIAAVYRESVARQAENKTLILGCHLGGNVATLQTAAGNHMQGNQLRYRQTTTIGCLDHQVEFTLRECASGSDGQNSCRTDGNAGPIGIAQTGATQQGVGVAQLAGIARINTTIGIAEYRAQIFLQQHTGIVAAILPDIANAALYRWRIVEIIHHKTQIRACLHTCLIGGTHPHTPGTYLGIVRSTHQNTRSTIKGQPGGQTASTQAARSTEQSG